MIWPPCAVLHQTRWNRPCAESSHCTADATREGLAGTAVGTGYPHGVGTALSQARHCNNEASSPASPGLN